jgi:hypothetical protein
MISVMDSPPLSIKSSMTTKDLYKLSLLQARRNIWTTTLFLLLFFCVVMGLLYVARDAAPNDYRLALPAVWPIYLFIAFWLISVFLAPFVQLWIYFHRVGGLGETISYSFANDCVQMDGTSYSSRLEWPLFVAAIETRSFLTLYLNKWQGFPIPKKDIPDQATLMRFRQILRDNIRGKIKLLS